VRGGGRRSGAWATLARPSYSDRERRNKILP